MQVTLTKFLGLKERGDPVEQREETEESDFESDCEDEDGAGTPATDVESDHDEPLPVESRTLQSDKLCHNICEHIGNEMRTKIYEATTVSKKSALVVYIKTCLSGTVEPVTFYLDLIELPGQDAESIYKTLLKCLESYGFSSEILSDQLIGFASDGASVMFGSQSGVAKRIQNAFPNVVICHCLNHRLELAVGDAVSEISGVNHFKILFDKLYHTYHTSAKNKKELEECCQDLTTHFYSIGRVLDTRWVASSFRTVKAVWTVYYPLHCHLIKASKDTSRNSPEQKTFLGLATKLSSAAFVLNLATMYDCLEELSNLSEDLQERKITLPRAQALIYRAIRVFHSMVDYPGVKYKEAKSAVEKVGEDRKFKGVLLQDNRKCDVVIHYGQFMRSLAANLEERLVAFRDTEKELPKLLNCITVLNPSNWPKECPLTYGNEEIQYMCDTFHLNDVTARRGFQEYIDNVREEGLLDPPDKLLDLFDPAKYVRTWKNSLADDSKARSRKRTANEEHDYDFIWKKLK
ncbi:E3 SUMO-protein ligase KIAA1586-like [Dysidea avara]|uniref:E3 SUMO-protein ligase KIAA1586-like n=1 Tax=Dysidea avara TaxID=196820 RepID=UPI0033283268